MRKTSKFDKKLIKEYGEQVYRDHLRSGNTLDDSSYPSAYVAEACGEIEEKDFERFRKAIVNYAKRTKFPKNFI